MHVGPAVVLEAGHEVVDGRGRRRRGDRSEADGPGAVGGPVDDQVVSALEATAARLGMAEEEPVQVQHEAGVQRCPVLLPDVVEGVPQTCELLLVAGAQAGRAAGEDAVGPRLGDGHALQGGGRHDGGDARPRRQLVQETGRLGEVEVLRAAAPVHVRESSCDGRGDGLHQLQVALETAHRTSQGRLKGTNGGLVESFDHRSTCFRSRRDAGSVLLRPAGGAGAGVGRRAFPRERAAPSSSTPSSRSAPHASLPGRC